MDHDFHSPVAVVTFQLWKAGGGVGELILLCESDAKKIIKILGPASTLQLHFRFSQRKFLYSGGCAEVKGGVYSLQPG